MDWFSRNPNPTGSFRDLQWDMHVFGRNMFASNFARGGLSSTMFAPTAGEAFKSAFRRTYEPGSKQHVANLERMVRAEPNNPNFRKALAGAQKSKIKHSLGYRIAGGAFKAGLGAAFIAMPAFTTQGGIAEKGRAIAGGVASFAGWQAGGTIGAGVGAAIGSIIPGLGTAIGGAVGYVAGAFLGAIGADEGTQALLRIPDNLVERERKKRNLNWVGNRDAFNTQSAATMRQMSLQAMNRGMTTGRSAMGREAIMFHR